MTHNNTKTLTHRRGTSGTGVDRRQEPRHDVTLNVNYTDGSTYLYSKASNISEMGIFIVTNTPLIAGTQIQLRFDNREGGRPIDIAGEVVWIDPGSASSPPGMGIRFIDPSTDTRSAIRSFIRTIAYID